jgi:hypothetical protein
LHRGSDADPSLPVQGVQAGQNELSRLYKGATAHYSIARVPPVPPFEAGIVDIVGLQVPGKPVGAFLIHLLEQDHVCPRQVLVAQQHLTGVLDR